MGLGDSPDFRQLFQTDDFVVGAFAAGLPHEGGGGNELGEILVGGDHVGFEAIGFRPFHQGADNVVRLEAVDLEDRDGEGAAEALHVGD